MLLGIFCSCAFLKKPAEKYRFLRDDVQLLLKTCISSASKKCRFFRSKIIDDIKTYYWHQCFFAVLFYTNHHK